MIRSTIGALVLLTFAGCSNMQSGTDKNSKPMSMDEARASAMRVSGSDVAACQSISYVDTDESTAYAYVVGWDGDDDGLAMVPTSWTDIYAEVGEYSQYLCLIDGMPVGYVLVEFDADIGADCDDTDALVLDAEISVYLDTDGDGFGDSADVASMACGVEEGYSSDNTDCDDSDWDINPDAEEVCDGSDNDCSGLVDDGLVDAWYSADNDGDTYGDPESQIYACSMPEGYVVDDTDCDDTEESGHHVNPGMSEECNDIDDNCDGSVDDVYLEDILFNAFDALSVGAVASYSDEDGDAYAGTWYGYVCSSEMEGLSSEPSDCDDSNAAVSPSATEILDNEVDEDCDGTADMTPVDPDPDSDSDGSVDSLDCDDANAAVYPGAEEILDNAVDEDCDGTADMTPVDPDPDSDGDGSVDSLDCDDANAAVYPGAVEVASNGIDDDCNGGVEVSGDGIDNDDNGVVEGEELCVDPIGGVDTLSAELYASNYTDDPNVLVTTGVTGTGTLCWEYDFTVGEQWKVNAPVSGGAFWWVMLDADNIDAVTFGGMAPSAETYHSWGSGRDLVATVPTFPTE